MEYMPQRMDIPRVFLFSSTHLLGLSFLLRMFQNLRQFPRIIIIMAAASKLPLFNSSCDRSKITITRNNNRILIDSCFHIVKFSHRLLLESTYELKASSSSSIIMEIDIIHDTGEILQIRFGNVTIFADQLLLGTVIFSQIEC